MNYENCRIPEELLSYMNQCISYGFMNKDREVCTDLNKQSTQDACKVEWYLSSPGQLIQEGYGHCIDQVELGRYWFLKFGYTYKTFFIWFSLPYKNTYSMHTYLLFEKGKKWYYFEHANERIQGIYAFDTYEEAIHYQARIHIEQNKIRNVVGKEEIECLQVYEYSCPKYGCNLSQFIAFVLETGTKQCLDYDYLLKENCIRKF